MRVYACLALTALPVAAGSLPPKILCAYSGFWLDREPAEGWVGVAVEPFREACFNSLMFKIQPPEFDLSDVDQKRRLGLLCEAVSSRGMALICYVYPAPHTGQRDPQRHADLPAMVGFDGKVDERHFSLVHWSVWRQVFDNAFQLAAASRELPIAAVCLDLETIHSTAYSYDLPAFRAYAAERGLTVDLGADGVGRWLAAEGLREDYEAWFRAGLEEVARRLERELHAVAPGLPLGFMPAHSGWFYEAFEKHLATAEAPALMDNWVMYNGGGYGPEVLREQERVKALNPHNRFIPWLRINSYRPESLAAQVYHAALRTDGYSNWTAAMLNPAVGAQNALYRLPEPYQAEDYLAAYRQANEAVLADLAAGRTAAEAIPFAPPRPLAPPLKLSAVKIPALHPAGDGTGEPGRLVLRNQQTIYFCAEPGREVAVELQHLAGKRIAIALRAVVLGPDRQEIADEEVAPGEQRTLTVTPRAGGLHALVVSGGQDGQAWYSVRVRAPHVAVATPAYFFYRQPFEVYLSRTDPQAPASVKIATGREEIFTVQLDDQPPATGDQVTFNLPPGREVFRLRFSQPDPLPAGKYIQDLYVSVTGAVVPCLADGPQRRLRIQ